jgi:hypothetical protein
MRALKVWLTAVLGLAAGCILAEDVRIWPLYYRNTDAASGETRQEIFWPLYSRYATQTQSVHKILSFQNEYPDQFPSQQYFLWPLTGFRWGEDLHDLWIFPFLWSASDGNRGHLSCFPLWMCWWRPNRLHLNLALLQHNTWRKNGQSHYLFPLLWTHWDESQYRKEFSHGVFPVFRAAKHQDITVKDAAESGRYASFYLFPFWLGSRGQDASSGRRAYLHQWQGLLPLFYATNRMDVSGKNKERGIEIWHENIFWLFPCWQKSRSRAPSENPPKTRAELEQLSTEDFQLDESCRLLPPFYWQQKKRDYHPGNRKCTAESEQFWLLPWWMNYRQNSAGELRSNWVFPAQWGTSRKKGQQELTQTKTWRAFWPLYRSGRESEQTAAGVVRLDSQSLWLFPWYSSAFTGPQARGNSWFLLFGGAGTSTQQLEQSQAEQGFRYVLPLYFQSWLRQNEGESVLRKEDKLWAFPYWRNRGQEKEQDFLPPFYFSDRQRHRNDFLSVAGLYNRREKQASLRRKQRHEAEQLGKLPEEWLAKWDRDDCFWQHLLPFWFRSFDAKNESHTIFPLYSFSDGCNRHYDRRETLHLPWLLGKTTTVKRADGYQEKTQSYALSLYQRSNSTWLDEKQQQQQASSMRICPLFSYSDNPGGNFRCWSTLPPFSYRRNGSIFAENSRSLSLPWHWLPLYRSETWQSSPVKGKTIHKNWLFPFYVFEDNETTETKRLSIFWFLYHREQFRQEKKAWGLGGGLSNYYELDSNGFEERSILYRLYRFRERSWFKEREIMPFYASADYANSDWHWSVLGGLFGAGKSGNTSWVKFLYIPFRKQESPISAEQLEAERLQRAPKHLEYALKYAEAGRFDRAAMEFLLAEGAFEKDYDLLLAAGNAYAKADAERFAEYFRKDLLSSQAILAGKGEKYRRGRAKQGLLRQALEFYRQAIELRGASSDLLCRMALCHLQLEENAEALQKLKQRDEQFPSFAAAADYFRVADKMYSSSKPVPAGVPPRHELLERMLERFPEHPLFYLYKAHPIDGDQSEATDLYEKAAFVRPPDEELMPLPINQELPCPPIHHWGDFPQAAKLSAYAAGRAVILLNERYQQARKAKPQQLTRELALEFKQRAFKLYPQQGQSGWGDLQILEKYHGEFGSDIALRQDLLELQKTVSEDPDKKRVLRYVQRSLLAVELRLSQLNSWNVRRIDAGATPQQQEIRRLDKADDGYIDLDAFYGGIDHCEIEAECSISAPAETQVQLRLGFDRELRVELNGKQVFGPKKQRIARRDSFTIPLTLRPGENTLKFYVKDDTLSCGFYARLSDPAGHPTGPWRWQSPPCQP